jgi:dTDP-4-amino-4,6-dideoxygalactose transaminase
MTGEPERKIEAVLEARTRRECVFMPSGRFAIHVAFRLLLSPGDRILMSPLEDDTVFFGALAAGLRPVMAPVSTDDGNIRVEAVADATWASINAVLTANIYGLPDRVVELRSQCARLEIPLIEDAAHALETDVDSSPIGSFGNVSVFSLSKHIPGRGGVLSLGPGVSRPEVARLKEELMLRKPVGRQATELAKSVARTSLGAVGLRERVHRGRQGKEPAGPVQWRIPLRASQLRQALPGLDLDQFDQWMKTAYPNYRMRQGASDLKRTLIALRDLEQDREERVAGVLRLRELDSIAPATSDGEPQPLLRVPLLIEDRDAVAAELRRHRLNVYFVYDPPLDEYSGPEFSEPSVAPAAARWWGAHVLPVDPRDAECVLELLAQKRIRLTAAARPPD